MFLISSVIAQETNYGGMGGYPWEVNVVVRMPVKEWAKLKKKGQLGQLYGIDISNALYAMNQNIPAHCPTVSDRDRAKNGIKTIRLSYRLTDPKRAEGLGLTLVKRRSEVFAKLGDSVRIA
jgi:hypothetical protein